MASALCRTGALKMQAARAITRQCAVGMRGMAAAAQVAEAPLYPDTILQAPKTDMAELGNGVRVASEAGTGELASLSVVVDVGSRFETEANNGSCAMLEALAFAGKEAEVAAMGGRFSAMADRERMTFSATVLKGDVAKALEVLADAAKGSNINAANVEVAKGVVQSKIADAKSSPEEALMDHLHGAAYLDTAMGMPVIGTVESVEGLSADSLKSFLSSNALAGSQMIVAGAGAVHQGALTDLSQSYLGDLSSSSGAATKALEPAFFCGSDIRMRFDSMPLAHVAVTFQGPPAGSANAVPLMLMQSLMGAYDETSLLGVDAASKWCMDLAEGNYAKNASTFNISYKDSGLFGVRGVCPDNGLNNFMWYTLYNLVYMCHKVTDMELARAKTQLKAHALLQSSGCEATAADIANQVMLHGRRVPAVEFFARVDDTTVNDIHKTAMEFINDQDHALAAVGPIHELPDYNWIRRRSYWLRY